MTRIAFCFAAVLALPLCLAAQQPTTDRPDPLALPDAPSALAVSDSSSPDPALVQNSSQSSAPATATPQAPTPATTTPQSTAAPAAQTPSTQTADQRRAQADKELKQEEQQRMLGVIPNFNTVMSGEAAPIDAKQKFHLFFKSSVDPFQFVAAGLDAAIEQGENTYPEWRQGFTGYAKRYGAAFADGFDGNFWGNAVLPSVLHQDPRYFRLGHGSFKRRLWYSVLSTVRCKGDNGEWQPNYSNVAGNFIGGAISNVYYPASDRGVGLTLERGLTVTAEGAIGSLAVEFYPDVIQHFRNRHKNVNPTP